MDKVLDQLRETLREYRSEYADWTGGDLADFGNLEGWIEALKYSINLIEKELDGN